MHHLRWGEHRIPHPAIPGLCPLDRSRQQGPHRWACFGWIILTQYRPVSVRDAHIGWDLDGRGAQYVRTGSKALHAMRRGLRATWHWRRIRGQRSRPAVRVTACVVVSYASMPRAPRRYVPSIMNAPKVRDRLHSRISLCHPFTLQSKPPWGSRYDAGPRRDWQLPELQVDEGTERSRDWHTDAGGPLFETYHALTAAHSTSCNDHKQARTRIRDGMLTVSLWHTDVLLRQMQYCGASTARVVHVCTRQPSTRNTFCRVRLHPSTNRPGLVRSAPAARSAADCILGRGVWGRREKLCPSGHPIAMTPGQCSCDGGVQRACMRRAATDAQGRGVVQRMQSVVAF
ncbi:hypothetical protein C8Q77DRAFT_444737 [Trametes polyzona]|nr:hypothetical protein C8Q77DRAFT_444737 [Trametes polyzona]